jgi:hypothetical protein
MTENYDEQINKFADKFVSNIMTNIFISISLGGGKGEEGKREVGNALLNKICFVTSLFGKDIRKLDIPGTFDRDPRFNYIMLTNFKKKQFINKTSWDIVTVDFNKLGMRFRHNIVRSRYGKFMFWKMLNENAQLFRGFNGIFDSDIIVYCDAFLSPIGPEGHEGGKKDWNLIYNNLFRDVEKREKDKNIGDGLEYGIINLIQDTHNDIETRKNGIAHDMMKIVKEYKDTEDNVLRTMNTFKKMLGGSDSGENRKIKLLSKNNYLLNTYFAYNRKCEETMRVLNEFWKFYSFKGFTVRDQPMWNFHLIRYQKKSIIYSDVADVADVVDVVNVVNVTDVADVADVADVTENRFRDYFIKSGKYFGHNISYY